MGSLRLPVAECEFMDADAESGFALFKAEVETFLSEVLS
jgi:hypothetical protein